MGHLGWLAWAALGAGRASAYPGLAPCMSLPPLPPLADGPAPAHAQDLRLARQAAAGSAAAWMELVQRPQGPVHGLLVRHVRPQEREDLFQDIFLRIHRGLPRFQGSAALSTWIFQIAMNTVRSHWETRARLRHREVLATDYAGVDDEGEVLAWDVPVQPDQDEVLEARQRESRLQNVRAEIRAMRPLDRQILLLRDVEGCSYDEIAQRLDVALGTVKSRLARARAHLADRLKGSPA